MGRPPCTSAGLRRGDQFSPDAELPEVIPGKRGNLTLRNAMQGHLPRDGSPVRFRSRRAGLPLPGKANPAPREDGIERSSGSVRLHRRPGRSAAAAPPGGLSSASPCSRSRHRCATQPTHGLPAAVPSAQSRMGDRLLRRPRPGVRTGGSPAGIRQAARPEAQARPQVRASSDGMLVISRGALPGAGLGREGSGMSFVTRGSIPVRRRTVPRSSTGPRPGEVEMA